MGNYIYSCCFASNVICTDFLEIMKDFELKPHISEVWPLKWIIPLVICGYLTGIGLILLWYELQPAHKTRDLTQLSLLYVCLGLLCTTMLFCRAVR